MLFLFVVAVTTFIPASSATAELKAGTAKIDITKEGLPANDRMYVRALVINNGSISTAIVTVDAVAIGEIGPIGNEYLGQVRAGVKEHTEILPQNVIVNASHCHGIVCDDVAERTIKAIRMASEKMTPVTVGIAHGHEDRISENRRLKLKNGREIDVRHAYSMPADEDVASVGPIDPEIGVLRLDRSDGTTLAVVYNYACHPIQGVPSEGNTADITGFSSTVIEENLGNDAVALFVQGCGGDINPALYKQVDLPADAEPLGNMLGLSTLKAVRSAQCQPDDRLKVITEHLELPRADLAERISAMDAERNRLLRSLRGTTLNLKTFLPLVMKYRLAPDYPTYYSHSYLHENAVGRSHLSKLDKRNQAAIDAYIRNVKTMEQLSRLQTNLRLLEKHQQRYAESGKRTVDVEVAGLRIGDFVMLTFPGELVVQIGLHLKERSPHEHTFVAGYTNGYIYYCPTAEQLKNVGGAQEDSDCMLAPEWQAMFETMALEMLQAL